MIQKIKFLKKLRHYSKKRTNSDIDYLKFQEFQAREVFKDLERIMHPSRDSFVIDFGCGKGGYTNFLQTKFRSVLGIDFYVDQAIADRKIFEKHDLLSYSCPQKADLIFCASVIEHVKEQDRLIKSLKNNLKNGGYLYLSFPPFYSPVGGHQLKPFHYLPERAALWLGKKHGRINSKVSSYTNLFGDWGLYKTTISGIKKLLLSNNFTILECKTRFSPINTSNIPLLGEFLTWHVEFYCKNGG